MLWGEWCFWGEWPGKRLSLWRTVIFQVDETLPPQGRCQMAQYHGLVYCKKLSMFQPQSSKSQNHKLRSSE